MNTNRSRLRIVLLGDTNVGKTSLVNRLSKNIFVDTIQTIGASFTIYKLDDVIFEIFDTAGQERYAPISHLYYRNAHIIILIFDVNNLDSLQRIYLYIKEIKCFNNNYKFILIGSKIDINKNNKNKEKISELIANRNFKFYLSDIELKIIYLSSKTGENINKLNKRLNELANSISINNNNLNHDLLIDQDLDQDNQCVC